MNPRDSFAHALTVSRVASRFHEATLRGDPEDPGYYLRGYKDEILSNFTDALNKLTSRYGWKWHSESATRMRDYDYALSISGEDDIGSNAKVTVSLDWDKDSRWPKFTYKLDISGQRWDATADGRPESLEDSPVWKAPIKDFASHPEKYLREFATQFERSRVASKLTGPVVLTKTDLGKLDPDNLSKWQGYSYQIKVRPLPGDPKEDPINGVGKSLEEALDVIFDNTLSDDWAVRQSGKRVTISGYGSEGVGYNTVITRKDNAPLGAEEVRYIQARAKEAGF